MTEMLSTRDMTVRSVIGSRGQTFALERPVPVRAGQRVYYGIRSGEQQPADPVAARRLTHGPTKAVDSDSAAKSSK